MIGALSRVETNALSLPLALARLRDLPREGPMLSVYLNTRPAQRSGHALLLTFRDRYATLNPDGTPTDAAFHAAVKRVENYLTAAFAPHSAGLAVFTGGALGKTLILVNLPDPPMDHVTWSEEPEIGVLEATLDEHERIAVALFDAEHTRLLSVFLGTIETEQAFEDEVPGKQSTGGWYALQQTRFARHREDHLRRHARRTVRALRHLLRAYPFEHLLLAGPEEPLALLRRELSRTLIDRLAGTLDVGPSASDAEVLAATLRAAEAIERRKELRLVQELFEAASTPRVRLGTAGTLHALEAGRVHLLFLSDTYAERESVIEKALALGVKVEIVSGDAATLLDSEGGIGAWTRF